MSDFASPDDSQDVIVFTEALLLPVGERAAFLRKACGVDADLRRRVEALLETHAQVGDFLEEPATESARDTTAAGEKAGDRIGHYKLLQQIGEGGWGVVYMAEQEEPVRRRVALKIIKPGMDTKNVIARFEAERQALALMDHPNIAKVFEAGATPSGRPYFVMELIRGIKITQFCDEHSLATEERLKLFMQVCQAVQHAHQKGIIHRDIKPSNILVTTNAEGVPQPVVIDFGIAKAASNQRLTDKTVFTAFEMLIGTPAYMSPEQAALTSIDVDTRTDIYSLGVLLYELLTGSTPFNTEELLKAGLDETRRVIREQEPERPSTRLRELAEADLTTVAHRRRAEPPTLIRAVRGDLDWIVIKALEKDRARRYDTAEGLARDVQRFLADEAISARPPSRIYRFQKTVVRNKLLFAGIGLVAGILVISLILIAASLASERQARKQATAALKQAEDDKIAAQTAAAKSGQVTRFLEDMLEGVGPSVARGRDTKMLNEILDRTAERVGTEMTNQPGVEAELRTFIGGLYMQIGKFERAEEMHRGELALYQKIKGPESAEAAEALNDLGLSLWRQGKLDEAESALAEALGIRTRIFGTNDEHVAAALDNLGTVYRHQRKKAQAEDLIRQGLAVRQHLFGAESLEAASSLHNLTLVLDDEGKLEAAAATAKELLEIRKKRLGDDNPSVAEALDDVAWSEAWMNQREKAQSIYEEALQMRRKDLGDTAPEVAKSFAEVGEMMSQRGKQAEAHAVLAAVISIQRKILGDDNLDTLGSLDGLGIVLENEQQWAQLETVRRETLALWRRRMGNEDPQALGELAGLIRALVAEEKFDEAERLMDEELTPAFIMNPLSGELQSQRVDLLGRRGKWGEAIADSFMALQARPADHYRYHILAGLLAMEGERPAYQKLCQEAVAKFGDTRDPYVAERIADDCLLLTNSGVDLASVGKTVDTSVMIGGGDDLMPFINGCKALMEYRLGHYAEAVAWAQSPSPSSDVFARAKEQAVVAMAKWQLGYTNTARIALAKGNQLTPPIAPGSGPVNLGGSWVAWVFARVSLEEATALIQAPATNENNATRP